MILMNCSFQLKKDQNLEVVNFFLDLKNLEIVLDANRFNISLWGNPSKKFQFHCVYYAFTFDLLDVRQTMKSEVKLFISLLNAIKQKNKVQIFFPRDLNEDDDLLIFEEIQPLLYCKFADYEIVYFNSF